MENKCVCSAAGVFRCGRCERIYYCSRNCQTAHWTEHKKKCYTLDQQQALRDKSRARLFDTLTKKIAGNIIIMNAWYRISRGYVEIKIDESLESVCGETGSHFLHLKYVAEESPDYDKYSEPDKCYIVYRFNNFEHTDFIKISLPAAIIREKQKKPTQEWSIMVEITDSFSL